MTNSIFSKIQNQYLIVFLGLFVFKILEVATGMYLMPIVHAESITHRAINVHCLIQDISTLYTCEETYFSLVYIFSFVYFYLPFSLIPLPYLYFIFIIFIGTCYYFFFKIFQNIAIETNSTDYIKVIAYPMFFLIFIDIYTGNSYGFAIFLLILSFRCLQKNRNVIAAFLYAFALYRLNFLILFPIFLIFSKKRFKFFVLSLIWAGLLNLPMLLYPNLIIDYLNSGRALIERDPWHIIAPIFPVVLQAFYPFIFLFLHKKKEDWVIPFIIIFNIFIIVEIIIIYLFSGILYPFNIFDLFTG